MDGMGRRKVHTEFWWGNLRERDHLEDPHVGGRIILSWAFSRGELSYLTPLGSENISAPYFEAVFLSGGGITPQTESNTTPPSPKTEITNILFYILNFASIITFKM